MRANFSQVRIHALVIVVMFILFLLVCPATTLTAKAQTQEQRKLIQKQLTTWPDKAKRFALVIGVDEYQDTQINKLSGASNDARTLADALIRYAGFPSENVILLASDQPVERYPTRGNILRRLSNLREAVQKEKDCLLLVSFAGHGMERGGRAYLLPSDAQVNGDISLVEETAINVEEVHNRIRQTGVKQVVIILDACRNDPVAGRGDKPNLLTESYARAFNFDLRNREVEAFATLYATAVGQVAHEYKEKKQGYFTWTLIEGLKGEAVNDKGEVTLSGLVNYVQEMVPKRIALDLGTGKEQRPFAIIDGYKANDLVISVAPKKDKVSQSVNTATSNSTSSKNTIANTEYDELIALAAENGHIETVRALLDKSANVNGRNKYGLTALMLAAGKGHVSVVQLLVDRGAEVNAEVSAPGVSGATALMKAAESGNLEVFQTLVNKGARVNVADENGYTLLMSAANGGNVAIISQALRDKQVAVNAKDKNGYTALMHAFNKKPSAITIKTLLAAGADVSVASEYSTPLTSAVGQGDLEIIEELLAKGADVNLASKKGSTPLMAAVGSTSGDTKKIVELLLAKGANVNAVGPYGLTALLSAVVNKREANIIELLLAKGADANLKDIFGSSAATVASSTGNTELLLLLLSKPKDKK